MYQEDNAAIQTPFSSTSTSFSLDHQKTFFGPDFKTFSWNRDTSVGCNHYRVTSVDCNGNTQRIWDQDVIQEASVAIPSSFVIDDHNHPLYFMIQSVNENGAECNRLPVDFAVNQSGKRFYRLKYYLYNIKTFTVICFIIDITETQSTSYHGTCTNVESEGGPAVVLPSKTLGNDCPCSIVLTTNNDYTLTNCSCASDTIFRDSFYVSKQMTTSNTYKTCLYNLTREMNNTVIHFYDLYRECTNRDGEERTKAFRMYLKSLKIVIGITNCNSCNCFALIL